MRAFIGLGLLLLCLGLAQTALAQGNVVLLGLRSVEGDDEFANTLTSALREQGQDIEAWEMSDRGSSSRVATVPVPGRQWLFQGADELPVAGRAVW